jgi:Arc/MetJ family transcription regulator
MKFSVEMDEATLKKVMTATGIKKKGPAVAKAATEYLRREMAKEFATMVMEGEFEDYPLTNDEIEQSDR